jgi:hypothetical protein
MSKPDPGPFGWFWAKRVTRPCPDCGHPTSVGFDRADPGASTREPTRCAHCTTAEVDNAIQFSRGELGYPLTERGPCASCGTPTRRYGPHGSPKCGTCAQPQAARASSPEPEPSLAGQLQRHPPSLEAQPEIEQLELSA